MAFEHPGLGALDYSPCRYGQSRLLFRGPRKRMRAPYALFLGGTETYGKFIPRPFPDLLEDETGLVSVNMGCVNAGIDAFLGEPAVLSAAAQARVTVVQVTGAHNLSNRFYQVHPRRNDRFVSASTLLRTVFREVDFTDFAFTRHLLGALSDRAPDRYELVVDELRQTWVARMALLLDRIETDTVLLWVAGHPPGSGRDDLLPVRDPLLVDASMVEKVRPHATHYVEVVASAEALSAGTAGMAFSPLEAPAALALPGPMVHEEVLQALLPVLSAYAQEGPAP